MSDALLAADDLPTALAGGLIGLFLLIFVVGLGIAWLIFPFIVISKCNEMLKLLRRIEERPAFSPKPSQELLAEARCHREALNHIVSNSQETNKALQWFVDNWPPK